MTDFATPSPQIPRDRYGRPLIVPPDGGKAVAYTRCTTFVDCLDDKTNLSKWMQRKVAQGLAMRPDLLMAIATLDDPDGRGKAELNRICEAAMEAAQSKAAATTGTALHKFTERLDLGQDVGHVPTEYAADLTAYTKATAGLEVVAVENFVVLDSHRVGGTFDRLVKHNGRLTIADVKTGSIDYSMGKIAMQLAIYAHAQGYDADGGRRTPLGDVDLEQALVIHLPAGKGKCDLVPVDIAAGWEAIPLAQQVRDWRTRKWATTPLAAATGLPDLIASATTTADLYDLWVANQSAWTDELTQMAAARKAALAA